MSTSPPQTPPRHTTKRFGLDSDHYEHVRAPKRPTLVARPVNHGLFPQPANVLNQVPPTHHYFDAGTHEVHPVQVQEAVDENDVNTDDEDKTDNTELDLTQNSEAMVHEIISALHTRIAALERER